MPQKRKPARCPFHVARPRAGSGYTGNQFRAILPAVEPAACNPAAERWRTLNVQTDECLAANLLAGEQDALAVLFDRYHRLVYSVAVRIVHDPGEAEEVVQTAFLDCYRALANFDPAKGTLKVWLLQYAYHRALHRKQHLEANRFYRWVELDNIALESHMSSGFDEVVESAQRMNQLLCRVNAKRRKILEFTYCEGLTAEEIAARTGESVNVVRHELYRALAALRKEFAKNQDLPEGTPRAAIMKEARNSNA
jgi:RNA polymerase sigma-70 factor, ECF subfamily